VLSIGKAAGELLEQDVHGSSPIVMAA
jgi:hypothetical protein